MTRAAAAARLTAAVLALASIGCQSPPDRSTAPLAPTSTDPPTEATCGGSAPEGVSVVRFSAEGACLDAGAIVLYRCSAADPPVLRVAADGGSASFLGGPFAVPVETLPADVRFVGHGDGTDVLVADPVAASPSPSATGTPPPPPDAVPARFEPLVYVRRDGVTERWLRLARRRAIAEPPAAWLIGDSILDGGRDAVVASFSDWSLTIDAEVGRASSEGVPLAQEAIEEDADAVLVELGTNDASADVFRTHLIETLDSLREAPLVVWQTARGPAELSSVQEVDDVIRRIVPWYPNAAIADWAAFVPADRLMADGIHPLEGAEGLESQLIEPLLSAWRDAVVGEGATSCGRQVVRHA